MTQDYWYFWDLITEGEKNQKRFNLHQRYVKEVDKIVEMLEAEIKKYPVGTKDFERCREVLNEMYQTQYALEHKHW